MSYVIAWKKLLYSGGTIAFKVSVGCDKEEVLVYSMVFTMDIKSYNGGSGWCIWNILHSGVQLHLK